MDKIKRKTEINTNSKVIDDDIYTKPMKMCEFIYNFLLKDDGIYFKRCYYLILWYNKDDAIIT